jgi:hypothetical protein
VFFDYERCAARALLKKIWRAFLPALHGLRLIAQTTAAETASGCPQTLYQCDVYSAANAIEFR